MKLTGKWTKEERTAAADAALTYLSHTTLASRILSGAKTPLPEEGEDERFERGLVSVHQILVLSAADLVSFVAPSQALIDWCDASVGWR